MSINCAKEALYHSGQFERGCYAMEKHNISETNIFIEYLGKISSFTIPGFCELEIDVNNHLAKLRSLYAAGEISDASKECAEIASDLKSVGMTLVSNEFGKKSSLAGKR